MKYLKLFLKFFKIGIISFGGGYGMILVLKKELVSSNYVDDDEFNNALVYSQASPGSLAVNMSINLGKNIYGTFGAIISYFGVIMPSFLIIYFLSSFLTHIKDYPFVVKFFDATKPAVLALICVSFLNLFKNFNKSIGNLFLFLVVTLVGVFFKISPIFLVIIAMFYYPIIRFINKFRNKI